MAIVALTSASGAPGTTTAALAFSLLWRRPTVLVEADMVGGSSVLAGYFRSVVAHDRGLTQLAIAVRNGNLEDEFPRQMVGLSDDRSRLLLPGVQDAKSTRSMGPLWGPLGSMLKALERNSCDVFVDAGRLGAENGPGPLLTQADVVLLVTRTGLSDLRAVHARAEWLRELLLTDGMGDDGCGLLLVGERTYTRREIHNVLGIPVIGVLAFDPVNAEHLSAGTMRPRRFDESPLVASARSVVGELDTLVGKRRARLAPTPVGQ